MATVTEMPFEGRGDQGGSGEIMTEIKEENKDAGEDKERVVAIFGRESEPPRQRVTVTGMQNFGMGFFFYLLRTVPTQYAFVVAAVDEGYYLSSASRVHEESSHDHLP